MNGTDRTLSPWPGRLTAFLGLLWLALFPLWQDGSYTRITRAKWLGMQALLAVTAAAVLSMVIVLLCRRRAGRYVRLHPSQLLALGYLGWTALSAFLGSMTEVLNSSSQQAVFFGMIRYEGLIAVGCYVAIFLLLSLLPVSLRPVMQGASLAMLAYAGVMGLQYAGFNPFGLFPEGMSVRTVDEFQGPIGNIDMVTGYVSLIMPALLTGFALGCGGGLCLAGGAAGVLILLAIEVQSGLIVLAAVFLWLMLLMLRCPQARRRGSAALAAMLILLSLRLLTGLPWFDGTQDVVFLHDPRGWKLLPVAAAAGLLLWGRRRKCGSGRAVSLRTLSALLAGLTLLALLCVALIPWPEGNGLWELREILHGRPQDAFGSERLGVWRITLDMSRENLLFGTGPDTFLYAFRDYLARTGQTIRQNFDNPHNIYLAILSGSGVPALLLFLALLGSLVIPALRQGRYQPWLTATAAGIGMYLLQGLFTFSICLVSPMFWAVLGLCAAMLSHGKRREVNHDDQQL